MSIARTLALALATAALVVPTAQAMPIDQPERPVNAPGATAVDSASVREQDLRHPRAGGDVRLQPTSPAPADETPWLLISALAGGLALVLASTALVLRRRRVAI